MKLRSPAYRTEMIFPRYDGVVHDRGDHLAIHTPLNPGYYWGNYLLYDHAPTVADVDGWRTAFRREFEGDHGVRHMAMGWDVPEGDLGAAQAFVDAGFDLTDDLIMVATEVVESPVPNQAITVRKLDVATEWGDAVGLNAAADPLEGTSSAHAEFKRQIRRRYERMLTEGLGIWLGAWIEGRLVGQLGIYPDGDLARLQSVETHPDFRRRGVCSALVEAASRFGLGELGAQRMILVAVEGDQAARIYGAGGYRVVGRSQGLHLAP
jgi:ribosomal protein S18 acetylase RimI-like enzyme